jgi:putative addiction module killer protein
VELRRYQTADGKTPLTDWLDGMRDHETRARVIARLDRVQAGLFGDWKSVGSGVRELRIDHGPGYRVYFGQVGTTVVLLLCGGVKSSQTTDIAKAHDYWKDYKARSVAKPPVQSVRLPTRRK